jgi:hypothetical protein
MKRLRIPVGVTAYRCDVYGQTVLFANTPELYNEVRKRMKMPPKETFGAGAAEWAQNDQGHNLFLIGVFDGHGATLAHEVAHICFFILKLVGVPVEPGEPNEAYCYLLGALYDAFAFRLLEPV